MERRFVTTLVLAVALAALAGVAIADAVRSGDGDGAAADEPEPAQTQRRAPTPQEELREAGAAGTIFVADTRCRVRGLRLPSLAEVPGSARPTAACNFAVTPRGAVLEGDGWYPPRLAHLGTEDGLVELTSSDGWVLRVAGTAPSWRPDGTLTVIRGPEVRAVDESCSDEGSDCTRLLLGESELRAVLGDGRTGSIAVQESAWLDERRVALVLSVDGKDSAPESVLGIWEGARLIHAVPGGEARFFDLRPSPRGGLLTARVSNRPDRLLILDREGRELSPADLAGDRLGRPRFRFVRALALSPSEHWVAIASRRGVYVFRRGGVGTPEVIRLRVNALDLVWQ